MQSLKTVQSLAKKCTTIPARRSSPGYSIVDTDDSERERTPGVAPFRFPVATSRNIRCSRTCSAAILMTLLYFDPRSHIVFLCAHADLGLKCSAARRGMLQ